MDKYLGKRLDGRYEMRELIGVGGMAYVYKAYDNMLTVIDNANIHYETLLLSLTPAAEDWISNGKGGYTYTTTFAKLITEESTNFSASAYQLL